MKVVVKDRPDVGGNVYGFLPTAVAVSAVERLSSLDDVAVVRFSAYDPTADEVIGRDDNGRIKSVWRRECSIWHDGVKHWEGPIVHVEVGFDGGCEMRVGGPGAYLAGWNWGDAERENLLADGGFETSGLPDWTAGGGGSITRDDDHVNEGDWAMKVVGAGGYGEQTFAFYHEHLDGIEPRIAAYVYREDAGAQPGLGLLVQMEADDLPGATTDFINADVPADEFKRTPWGLGRPLAPFVTWNVTLRLYGSTDGLWWDSAQAGLPESIGALIGGSDIAAVLALLVATAQADKNDVGILVDVTPAGVIVRDLQWQYVKHERVRDSFAQVVSRSPGCEYRWDLSSRTIEIAATVGERKPEWTLRVGHGITDGSVSLDGLPVRTSAVRAAEGSDFLLEEGGYVDATGLDGLIRDVFERAPVSAPIRELVPLAKGDVEAAPQCVEDYDLVATVPLDSGIRVGDVLPTDFTIGAFTAEAVDLRVVETDRRLAEGFMALGLVAS